jgi:soluble cytochrome b562
MNKNVILTALIPLTAGFIALMALPTLAAAGHDDEASCAVPTDYPTFSSETRRTPPIERRLRRRMKAARQDVRQALNSMEGLKHWRTERQLKEARRRVTDARHHLDNGAFRAADRTLSRVDELVRTIRRKAVELGRVRATARTEMRSYKRDLSRVIRRVDEANCTVAAGYLRKAEGAFSTARRQANRFDWDFAGTYARTANRFQRDALRQALATIEQNRVRDDYQEALAHLTVDIDKARRSHPHGRARRATREYLREARQLKSRAQAAARRGEYARARKLANRGMWTSHEAREIADDSHHARRAHRHSRRRYSAMPLASARARWTSSGVR